MVTVESRGKEELRYHLVDGEKSYQKSSMRRRAVKMLSYPRRTRHNLDEEGQQADGGSRGNAVACRSHGRGSKAIGGRRGHVIGVLLLVIGGRGARLGLGGGAGRLLIVLDLIGLRGVLKGAQIADVAGAVILTLGVTNVLLDALTK